MYIYCSCCLLLKFPSNAFWTRNIIANTYQIARLETKQSALSYNLLNYTCIIDESGQLELSVPNDTNPLWYWSLINQRCTYIIFFSQSIRPWAHRNYLQNCFVIYIPPSITCSCYLILMNLLSFLLYYVFPFLSYYVMYLCIVSVAINPCYPFLPLEQQNLTDLSVGFCLSRQERTLFPYENG